MTRWPLSVRLGAGATALVAAGSAVLSWDALSWGAGQLGVDPHLTWLYPVVIDGTIGVGTVAALALRRARNRIRVYVWSLLAGAVSASVVGNGAHAAGGNPIHLVGAAVPAVALAASLHLLVILVRQVVPETDTSADTAPVIPASPTPPIPVVTSPVAARALARPSARTSSSQVAAGRAVRRAVSAGREPTTAAVAKAAGVSERQARRLRAAALADTDPGRRPRVVSMEAAPVAAVVAEEA